MKHYLLSQWMAEYMSETIKRYSNQCEEKMPNCVSPFYGLQMNPYAQDQMQLFGKIDLYLQKYNATQS
jgi:hypothetical protein